MPSRQSTLYQSGRNIRDLKLQPEINRIEAEIVKIQCKSLFEKRGGWIVSWWEAIQANLKDVGGGFEEANQL